MNELKQISISIPANFSFKEILSFLDRGFDECLYHLENDAVSRLIELSDGRALITICQKKEALEVEIIKNEISEKDLREVEAYVLGWFDLKRDLEPFYTLLSIRPELKEFPAKYFGTRLIGIPNLFEALCWAITGQQINLTFAYKLKRILVEKYGEQETINNRIYYIFPAPEVLAKADRHVLVEMKFSRQKIDYIINISNAFIDNKMSISILLACENKEERMEKLTAIKGIGIWTANYVLMKTMRDMSCITYGDSGLNRALTAIFKTNNKPTDVEVDYIFKDFKNWESYLNFYLWRYLE